MNKKIQVKIQNTRFSMDSKENYSNYDFAWIVNKPQKNVYLDMFQLNSIIKMRVQKN